MAQLWKKTILFTTFFSCSTIACDELVHEKRILQFPFYPVGLLLAADGGGVGNFWVCQPLSIVHFGTLFGSSAVYFWGY